MIKDFLFVTNFSCRTRAIKDYLQTNAVNTRNRSRPLLILYKNLYSLHNYFSNFSLRVEKCIEQAGAKLCQAQVQLALIGETLGLVPVSRLSCPRLLVSSRSRVKISTWSCLGLVSLCLKCPVSSCLSLAFIFQVKSCPGLVSVARNWSRHLKKIKH